MKKALAFILTLAMLISVFSMITVTTLAEGEAETPIGFKHVRGEVYVNYQNSSTKVFSADDIVDGYISHKMTIINPNNKQIVVEAGYQAAFATSNATIDDSGKITCTDGWYGPASAKDTDTSTAFSSFTIPAYGKMTKVLSFPVFEEGGKYYVYRTATITSAKEANDYNKNGTAKETITLAEPATVVAKKELGDVFVRLNCKFDEEGEYFIVVPESDDAPEWALANKTSKDKNGKIQWTNPYAYVSDLPAYINAGANADAELGTTSGWYNVHGGADITNVVDPDDASNRVIKWSPNANSSMYTSISFDASPFILKDTYVSGKGYSTGGGAGYYLVKFRVRAEQGNSGVFNFCFNSAVHKSSGQYIKVDGELYKTTLNTYTNETKHAKFSMTDEWQEIAAVVEVSQTYLDELQAYADSDGKIYNADGSPVLNGSGNPTTFSTTDVLKINFRMSATSSERFAYYIDDVNISKLDTEPETATGRMIEIVKDLPLVKDDKGNAVATYPYWRAENLSANGFITPDMADENGIIKKQWKVYNLGTTVAHLKLFYQGNNGWSTVVNSNYDSGSNGTVLAPGESAVFTSYLQLDENGKIVTDAGLWELSSLTFRMDIATKVNNDYKGIKLYIEPVEKDIKDPIFSIDDVVIGSRLGSYTYAEGHSDEQSTRTYLVNVADDVKVDPVGAAVSVGNDMSIDYVLDVDNYLSGDNVAIEFTRNGKSTVVEGVRNADGAYHFNYTGINAQCMGDVISAKVLVYGTEHTILPAYSVKQNVVNLYNATAAELGVDEATFAKLKTFLADMLAYGAEAQKYTGYKTNELVNDDLDWATSQFVAPQPVANKVVKNDVNNQVTSVGLNVSNDIKIYYRLAVQDGAVVKINGEVVEVVDGKVYTDGILATEFDKVFTLTVEVGGEVVTEINYSVNTYVYAMQDSAKTGALAKAIGSFGASAAALA